MSVRHSEYETIPGDLYCTPSWVTRALKSVETFSDPIWEPACGESHISNVLRDDYNDSERSYIVYASDIHIGVGVNFLDVESIISSCKSIITNPPYSNGMAEKFVRHALKLTEPVKGKVAMLLPINFDAAKTRRDLFAEHPAFIVKYILTKRIRWANLEQKKNGPSQNHAWFVWDWKDVTGQPPVLGYLP